MNELFWVILLLVNFSAILLAYRLFGKTGLFIWIPIATIVANVQVLKMVDIFTVTATLGNIVYASSFLVTDILSENYGKKAAVKAVKIGFFSLISMTALMYISLKFIPSPHDFAHESLTRIFGIMPRIALASLTAYLLSQTHDIWMYNVIRNKFPAERFIWLRNNGSTMISQLIDTTVFTFIAFIGLVMRKELSWDVFWQIFWTTYPLKWVVAAADTPFIYIASYWHRKELVAD
ncbi:MAG: queuosine precursor transporter [Spirochaetaceae bacterium]|nr:queuosine precursor transporter [Spirochaetaceae bacterium]